MSSLVDIARSLAALAVLTAGVSAHQDAPDSLVEGAGARRAALVGARLDVYEETASQYVPAGPTAARRVVVRVDGARQRFEQWHVEAVRRPVAGLPTAEDPWQRAAWVEREGRLSIALTDGTRALVLGEHHARPGGWNGRRIRGSSDALRRDVLEGILAPAEFPAGFEDCRPLSSRAVGRGSDRLLLSPLGTFVRAISPQDDVLVGTRFERFSCPPGDDVALRDGAVAVEDVRRRFLTAFRVLETTAFRGVELPSRLEQVHGITTRTRWIRYGELDAADGWSDPRRPAGVEGDVATFDPETGAARWMDVRAWAKIDVDDDALLNALRGRR